MVLRNDLPDVAAEDGLELLERGSDLLDGASVQGLGPADRQCVTAYMTGLDRGRRLCCGRSALETCAARTGAGLVIQTRLDAGGEHLLHLAKRSSSLELHYRTASDRGVLFLRDLLEPLDVVWRPLAAAVFSSPLLQRGEIRATRKQDLLERLEAVAAVLPLLPGLPEALRNLELLVRPDFAARILVWAARKGIGHAAFLELQGPRLIQEALSVLVPGGPAMLRDAIGEAALVRLLKQTLVSCQDAALAAEPADTARERMNAALRRRLTPGAEPVRTAFVDLLEIVVAEAEHLLWIRSGIVQRAAGEVARYQEMLDWLRRRGDLATRRLERGTREVDHRGVLSATADLDRARSAIQRAAGLLDSLASIPAGPEFCASLGHVAELLPEAAQATFRLFGAIVDRSEEQRATVAVLASSLHELVRKARQEEARVRGGLIRWSDLTAGFVVTASEVLALIVAACEFLARAADGVRALGPGDLGPQKEEDR